MKSETQVVVIGGGVVGASVLYHLTKAGWTDVVLLERRELTAGSTWHAAGGMHTLNGDPNVARLQQYTIQLYEEIERVTGQDCSIHLPGGLMLADTEVRMDLLRMAQARGRYLGMDLELITPKEAPESSRCWTRSTSSGRSTTRSRATSTRAASRARTWKCAQLPWRGGLPAHAGRRAGAARGRHLGRPRGGWRHDPHGARRQRRRPVGPRGRPVRRHRAAGPRDGAHVPPHRGHARGRRERGQDRSARCPWRSTSPARSTSARKAEAMLLGTYEQACVPWSPRETPWDFGSQLLQAGPGMDHARAVRRVQALPGDGHNGIKRGRQRAVHVRAGRQPAGRAGARVCAATGSPAA